MDGWVVGGYWCARERERVTMGAPVGRKGYTIVGVVGEVEFVREVEFHYDCSRSRQILPVTKLLQ